MTREELEKIYNEPQTTLTREKLNEIYNPTEPSTQQAKSVRNTKAVSSHDLMERQKRNIRVNQYKADKNVRNEANKLISQQNTNKMLGIETVNVGAEKYNSAPQNTVGTKEMVNTMPNNVITQNGNTENELPVQKIDTWLDPSYKLSKEEEKEAKEYIKQWRKENNAFKNNPYKTKEGTRILQKIAELESKLSGGNAAWAGFTNAIPFLGQIQDKITNSFGDTNTKEVASKNKEVLEASKMQNPFAAQAGNIAGEIAKYSAGTELLAGVGLLGEGGKITQGVSKVIKNPKVAGSVANILGDTSVDVALDTIPQLMGDISKGEQNVGTNALKSVVNNLAFNTLGEGVGIVGGKALGKAVDAYKNSFGKVNSLNPLEYIPKKVINGIKESDYTFSQIVNDVAKKSDDEIFDPVEKAFKDPNVGLTHTPEQLNQMKEYYNSIDEGIIEFVNEVRSKDKNAFTEPYELKNVSNRAAEDIKKLTGIKAVDNKILLNKDTIFHIDDGHGKNGISDKSMADDKTLSRIQYILDNYDGVFLGEGTTKTRLKDGSFAPTVVFYKKVDGNYFVVEAVTDAKSKKNMIVSAYCSNKDVETIKKEMYQAGNVRNLPRTSETHPELISDYSIPNSVKSVNGTAKNTEINNAGTISKVRSNTLANSDINTLEELSNKYLDENNFRYQEISEKQSMEEATTRVGLNAEHWKNKLMKQDSLSGTDVDTMMLIYSDTVQKARQSGDDELWKEAGAIFKKIQESGTKGGQLVQSFAKWSRNTPEGAVAESFRQAKEQATKVIGDKKAQKLIDDLYENVQKEVYTLANEAFEKGIDTKEGKEAFAKIGQIINANTPKNVGGVVKTYLMDSMLLNFRTLISRNAGGNLGYNAMEFARQPITAAIDKGVSKFTGQRTRTGWSIDKVNSALSGLAKGITDEFSDVRRGVHTAKSGENTIENAIQLNSYSLKGNNPVSSAINKIDDLTKHMLSIGDRPFYEAAYKQRMAELTELRRKGLLGEEVSKMSDADFNAFAELSAKMDGLTATYQDKGDMAKAFTDLKHAIGQYSKGAVGFDALSQFAMPFTNTPGNIITRSLEYSPLGVIKNTANTIGELRKGEFNQQRFVDELGRNILGTGLFAGGIAAYDNGLMTGSYSDDKDMKNAQKNSGMQEYALRTNLGGKEGNFDISWIPVLGNNMIMAAATKEAFDKGENTVDAFGKAASASANALLNTSTLQGLNRVFGGSASYSTENNLFENAKDALTSGFGQAIPSFMRQVAQSTDEYERNLNDGDRPYWQNSMINSIPVLREQLLQPKVDNEGNLIQQNQGRDLGSRLLENMISPGKYTEIRNSPVNAESMRLFESTGNNYSFLPTASRSDITKDDFKPTDEQYREYQQKLGSHNSELAGALIESSYYNRLSDEGKENALKNVYSAMKALAKQETLPDYETDDKITAAYIKGGVKGAISFMEKKNAFDTYDVDMSGKIAQAAYAKDGVDGIEDYSNYTSYAKSLGLSVNESTYNVWKSEGKAGLDYLKKYKTDIASLGMNDGATVKQLHRDGGKRYLEIYKDMDTDGKNGVTQKEINSYARYSSLSPLEEEYFRNKGWK